MACKVDTLRWRWLLTLSLRLESILDPGLCGDNHPLITVIYLLVGQDNSCSAGDVDLREKERQREERKYGEKWVDNWRLMMLTRSPISEIIESSRLSFFSQTWRHLVGPWWSGLIASHNQGRHDCMEGRRRRQKMGDGEEEDGGCTEGDIQICTEK